MSEATDDEEMNADETATAAIAAPLRFSVTVAEAGERLDRWLGNKLRPTWSRSFLVGRIEEGAVRVDGRAVRPSHPIAAGEEVVFDPTPPPDKAPKPEAIPFHVFYEDAHLAVIRKPLGMVVHPGAGTASGTLVNALLHRWPQIATVGVPERPGIVHRLDRDTSGIMVVALSNSARYKLVLQWKNRQVKKEYRAIVVGKIALQSDYIDLPLGQDPKHPERQRVDVAGGKPSSTFYDVIERLPGYTYVRCSPLTGRTHQIRVHLSHLGHPCVADPLYGRQIGQQFRRLLDQRERAGLSTVDFRRQALHAFRLRFTHPVDGREIDYECPLEEDMERLLAFLQGLK